MDMTTESKTLDDRVAAGAAWLDRVDPTWVDRIDLNNLDLNSACGCVLGQIVSNKSGNEDLSYYDCTTGSYYDPATAEDIKSLKADLPRGVKSLAMTYEQAANRGFHVSRENSQEWLDLTKVWAGVVIERRV